MIGAIAMASATMVSANVFHVKEEHITKYAKNILKGKYCSKFKIKAYALLNNYKNIEKYVKKLDNERISNN